MEGTLLVALAAAAGAVLALVGVLALWVAVRRLRAAQQVLLPDGATAGLIDRQASLQRAVTRVEQGLSDLQSLVERQGEVTERSLRSALRFQGMVRYDAYRDMGGSQSWSIALIDGNQTGAVVTSLHARDHARSRRSDDREGRPRVLAAQGHVVGDDEPLERLHHPGGGSAVHEQPQTLLRPQDLDVREHPPLNGERQRGTRLAGREHSHVVGEHALQKLRAIVAGRHDDGTMCE